MGIYRPAYDGSIHMLCIAERELSRMMKEWKAASPEGSAPDYTSPLYEAIQRQRRDIHKYRNDLGLTPTGANRLRSQIERTEEAANPTNGNPAIAAVLNQIREATRDK